MHLHASVYLQKSEEGKELVAERARSARQQESLQAQLAAAKLQAERGRQFGADDLDSGEASTSASSSSSSNGVNSEGSGVGGDKEKAAEGMSNRRCVTDT